MYSCSVMPHNHSPRVPDYLIGLEAGQDTSSSTFQCQYDISVGWEINCTACCWTYLTDTRRYMPIQGEDNRVTFGQPDRKWTQCFISHKQENSKHGQFKTKKDPESYGKVVAGSLIKKNSTFRLYSTDYTPEPTVIGTSINAVVRVESIAVPCVMDQNIPGSCLNYNNAAILELYRDSNRQLPLKGVCEVVSCQAPGITTTDAKPKGGMTDKLKGLKLT